MPVIKKIMSQENKCSSCESIFVMKGEKQT
jgi:hypothetical protein